MIARFQKTQDKPFAPLFGEILSVCLPGALSLSFWLLYHNLARFSMPENPDIFRVVQYIMLYEAGEKWGN